MRISATREFPFQVCPERSTVPTAACAASTPSSPPPPPDAQALPALPLLLDPDDSEETFCCSVSAPS